MKKGIDLITDERNKQLQIFDIDDDIKKNGGGQLSYAAGFMAHSDLPGIENMIMYKPTGWDLEYWAGLCQKPYRERLIIAGALIAAEIDRLDNQ